MSALEDRRRAARDVFEEEWTGTTATAGDARDAAIETATRVRITPEMIADVRRELAWTDNEDYAVRGALETAFSSAGFEVEP